MTENEADWTVFYQLSDNDWHMMLPGKVGIVRKIKILLVSQVNSVVVLVHL